MSFYYSTKLYIIECNATRLIGLLAWSKFLSGVKWIEWTTEMNEWMAGHVPEFELSCCVLTVAVTTKNWVRFHIKRNINGPTLTLNIALKWFHIKLQEIRNQVRKSQSGTTMDIHMYTFSLSTRRKNSTIKIGLEAEFCI